MPKKAESGAVKIRRAGKKDVARLAALAGELGYPTTAREMKTRFAQVSGAGDNTVFVAEAGGEAIGWLHVSVSRLLEEPRRAEVNGLIVSAQTRSQGAGALLLDAAEAWSRKKKCVSMSVRSNVIRERAHKFYERRGYEHYKTQKAFRKPL
jgi:ribosomal protein S18 acetylase RimI-like enzyme